MKPSLLEVKAREEKMEENVKLLEKSYRLLWWTEEQYLPSIRRKMEKI